MKSMILRISAAVLMLGISQGLVANGFPQAWIDCDPTEPFKGKAQEVYLGDYNYCYRIEFKCDEELSGGFLMEVNTDDGGVGLFGGVDSQFGFCGMGFAHLGNNQFTHACSFDDGDVELEVKAVEGEMCQGF